LEGQHCFPKRESSDETYRLSRDYGDLFRKTYDFCSEIVKSGQAMNRRHQRVRFWGALALLRCVMSSPSAAVTALAKRHGSLSTDDEEMDFRPFIFESADDRTDDDQPAPPLETAEQTLNDADRRQLRELGVMAGRLLDSASDTKLAGCARLVSKHLGDGFHPIVWCRYIATADYVAEGLQKALQGAHSKVRVVSITGRIGDEERRAKVDELAHEGCRVLVATDCLSEGINLQHAFDAVLHYDLPWNPNRLEQREGRVDRHGQTAPEVKACLLYGADNPIDGIVLDVLLRKVREIKRATGINVPFPEDSQSIIDTITQALLLNPDRRIEKKRGEQQQLLFDYTAFGEAAAAKNRVTRKVDEAANRETASRSVFAQHAIKAHEIEEDLRAVDEAIGDPKAVQDFVTSTLSNLLGVQVI